MQEKFTNNRELDMRKKMVVPGLWLMDQVVTIVQYQSLRWANQEEQTNLSRKNWWVELNGGYFFFNLE